MGSRKHRITVQGKDIAQDEPLFLLRAQDHLAAMTVNYYGDRLEDLALGAETLEERERLLAMASDCRAVAIEMQGWQLDNPERVKIPD